MTMRRVALHRHVTELIEATFVDDDANVAEVLLEEARAEDSGFSTLCFRLDESAGGDAATITGLFERVAKELTDNQKDSIADGYFDSACAFLVSVLRQL